MPARFSGRTNNKNRSGSGMEENPPHLRMKPIFRPVRMLRAQSGSFHLARRPIKPLRQTQPPFTGHSTKDFNLFRIGLLIRKHGCKVHGHERQIKLSEGLRCGTHEFLVRPILEKFRACWCEARIRIGHSLLLDRHHEIFHDIIFSLGRVLAHVKPQDAGGIRLGSVFDLAQFHFFPDELLEFIW